MWKFTMGKPKSSRLLYSLVANVPSVSISVKPNLYDAFSNLHKGLYIRPAHFGSMFFGWHRVFLTYFELALRRKNPSVTLPYWDSTLDFDMNDPTNSIVFSSDFLGNGNGVVETGPFKNWITPDGFPLMRDVGCPGLPFTHDREEYFLKNNSILYHSQVTEVHNDTLLNSIEFNHNAVHVWVGETMGLLETSTQDPIFFLHHSYVDYVWEQFRQKQIRNGIRPDLDYPAIGGQYHEPLRPIAGFHWLQNIQSYSNIFTSQHYTFERSPECPSCGGSEYLKCSKSLKRCVSKSEIQYSAQHLPKPKREMLRTEQFSVIDFLGDLFNKPLLHDEIICRRYQKLVYPEVMTNIILPTFPENDIFSKKSKFERLDPSVFQPIRNTFSIDGVADIRRWAFTAVRIIYNRKWHILSNPSNQHLRQAKFPKCLRYEGKTINRIILQTDGISYKGQFFNHLLMSENSNSEGFMIMGFKNPKLGSGAFYVTVSDVYGRICKVTCLIPDSHPVKYRPCTGVVQATDKLPTMHGRYEEVLQKVKFSINRRSVDIFLTFLCDLDIVWPWRQYNRK